MTTPEQANPRGKYLFVFRAAGEYCDGAAAVISTDWEQAAQLLRNLLAARYTEAHQGLAAYYPDGSPRYTRVYGREEYAPLFGKKIDDDH